MKEIQEEFDNLRLDFEPVLSRLDTLNNQIISLKENVSSMKKSNDQYVYVDAVLYGAEGGGEEIIGCSEDRFL